MRAVCAAVVIALVGCWYSGNWGAQTRRPDYGNERDPDPMADPNRAITENPYDKQEQPAAPAKTARERVKRRKPERHFWTSALGVALAFGAGGWLPMAGADGKFEEDPQQAKRYNDDEAKAAEEAAEAARKKVPVEQAPKAE